MADSAVRGKALGSTAPRAASRTAAWTLLGLVAVGRSIAGRWFVGLGVMAVGMIAVGVLAPLGVPVASIPKVGSLDIRDV